MKAAWYETLGPAETVLTVGDIPTPTPAPGEVLVRLAASGINPSDVKKRAGWHGGALEFPRIVPHSDGAGVIEAVGDGVPLDRIGQHVWVYNAQWERPNGTAAEYVALPAALAVPLPDGVGFEEGACLGIPACTAHYAVTGDGPVEGRTVLVQGGAGAVGFYAVQMAALSGATVIATVSSPEKAAIARAGGAHHTVDYKRDDVGAAVLDLTGGAGVDHIVEVDLGANIATDTALLKRRGSVAAYSSTSRPRFEFDYYGFGYKGARLRFVQVYILTEAERRTAVADLTRWMTAGRLRHRVAEAIPLDAIAEAHHRLEAGGVTGNIVVTC
ncbi:MAG: NADPH:quinone reductase [Alphaproteobacteria bacterium]|nr:NADPH:quinone reductase [Alphaproteobacteria bacterium]